MSTRLEQPKTHATHFPPCKLCRGTGKYRGYTGRVNLCACAAGLEAFGAETLNGEHFQSLSRPEQIAHLVRFNAERWAMRSGYKPTLQYLCGLCTAALIHALRREGFKASAVEGIVNNWRHAWVRHDGKIVDVTFTQFDINAPRVLFTRRDDARFKPLKTFSGKRLDAWLSDWRLQIRRRDIDALTTFDCPAR